MPANRTSTLSEASDPIARMNATRENGNLFDLIQPNGKPMRDRTGEEMSEIAQAVRQLARLMG